MCDCDVFSCVKSLFSCGMGESQPYSHNKKHKHHSPSKTIYQRVSMLLPTEEFSFRKACEHLFPNEEHYSHTHNTMHALLPIVITKDGHMYAENRPRKR